MQDSKPCLPEIKTGKSEMPDKWNNSQSQCGASIFLFGNVLALKSGLLFWSKSVRDLVEVKIGEFCHDIILSSHSYALFRHQNKTVSTVKNIIISKLIY